MALRIIITTGGTGGHIFPALAVIEALRKRRPDIEILFVGGEYGPERDIVQRAGVSFEGLPVRGFIGRGPRAVAAMFAMAAGIVRAMGIVRRFSPDAVMGFGGYAAFASVFAARLMGRPAALHEQNAIAGAANRILGRMVKRVCLSWNQPAVGASFPQEVCVLTGNPIRADIATLGTLHRVREGAPRLLVMGGSQGARAINNMVVSMLPALREAGVDILHQTGANEYESVRRGYLEAGVPAEETDRIVHPFIHDMAKAYAECDLALCRAGATSMAELAATGTPAVFIPFPYAAHDHQTSNARAMEEAGGGILLPQKKAEAMAADGSLAPMLIDLLKDGERLDAMRKGALSLARPDAADSVASVLLALAGDNSK